MIKKYHNLNIFLFISFLALSLPLLTSLVIKSQDNRSKASTEEETSKSKISFKIAFKGVKPNYSCLSTLDKVNLEIVNVSNKNYQSDLESAITPIPNETNKEGDQVFLVSNLSLSSKFNSVNNFNYLRVFNQSFLTSRMCLNNQDKKVDKLTPCDINLSDSNTTTYDFSNYPLIPGDLNQDSIVNTSDFSVIKTNIDSSADSECSKTGDINFDGMVNVLDLGYLKKSLLSNGDDGVLNVNEITPTPTSTPTPTAVPYPTRERVFTNRYVGPMKYWIYEPVGYTPDPNKKWPIIVFLHGRAETGTNINLLLNSGLPALLNKGANYDAFIIAPQYNDGEYDGIHYEQYIVEHLIPHVLQDYGNIDTDRISLTGHSMGANTTAYMAGIYPNFFSCFVTVSLCGYNSSQIPTIAKLTVKAFHGGNDSQCNVYNTNKFISEIKKAGGTADAIIYPSAGHVITNAAYSVDNINWMIKQIRGQPRKD